MAKGLYTQGIVLLTDGRTTFEKLKSALQYHRFPVLKETPPSEDWQFGGEGVVIPFHPEVNGYASIDVVNHPWPDSMGDPKSDPALFGAWSMGNFGPYAYPGGLARARQHAYGWPAARTLAQDPRGFIRIRLSYVFGANDNAPVMPADYDPVAELQWLDTVALALLDLPGVICYFNPNGEVLTDRDGFRRFWQACRDQQKLPLQLWTNVRLFDVDAQFSFMDTVGNSQLDLPDVEAIAPKGEYDPGDIDYYLRNVTYYLLDRPHLQTDEPIDGPGETNLTWTIELLESGLVSPPRRVVRLCPRASQRAVRKSLASRRPA
jgi:hypothetical protein